MGRPKIGIIFEHSITYLLKKKKSYRNIQRELKGHEHEIWILTVHRVKHWKHKTLCTRSKKPKIGPFRKTPQVNKCSYALSRHNYAKWLTNPHNVKWQLN